MSAEDWKIQNCWTLARLADCMDPDTAESAGATFLISVLDAVLDAVEHGASADDLMEDVGHEIADAAPSIYTAERFREFTDLGAWQEDVDQFGSISDLASSAGIALYLIARRLVEALAAEMEQSAQEISA